jgi:hypothetical protein
LKLLLLVLLLVLPAPSGAPDTSSRRELVVPSQGLRGAPQPGEVHPAVPDGLGSAGSQSGVRSGAPLQGWATYCAPTPTHCQGWGGDAHLGAVPGYGGRPYLVTVRHGKASTIVRVVSSCACGLRHGIPTVIDLSPAAFRELAPLSRGVIRVTVSRGGIRLPNTDTSED